MKHIPKIMIILLMLLAITGCSNDGDIVNRVDNGNNVDKVINEQIDNAQAESSSADLEKEPSSEPKSDLEGQKTSSENKKNTSTDVDYDLTDMNSDMVYATVYQMMSTPDTYIGKTIRMAGLYYAGYYEPTAQYYHYCIIQDALACCSQGVEFVWEDGSHIYPDEYPEQNSEVMVQGTFETYTEDEGKNLYCRLDNATMEVINE